MIYSTITAFCELCRLNDIKLVELNIGRDVNKINVTEPNEIQTQILKLFKMKKTDLET